MLDKKNIYRGAVSSVLQIIVVGTVLFFLYRLILARIGAERLGLWSLVLASTSLSQIATMGITGGIVKFVATYRARDETEKVSILVQTAALATVVFYAAALIILYPGIYCFLPLVVSRELLDLARAILPYALISLWLNLTGGIYQSVLDGCQRVHIRNSVLIGSYCLYLGVSFILVPRFNLMGLAYAQIIQNIAGLVLSVAAAKRYVPGLPAVPRRWSRQVLKEILPYGAGFQVISISQMLYDPMTKALLSRFGGLGMVAYYEMASKMILQVRSLLISANMVLVPTIAHIHERDEDSVSVIYREAYNILFFFSVPVFSFLVVFIPVISEVWIGTYSRDFVFFSGLLSAAWFLNLLTGPAYYCNLGTGMLKWNIVGHVAIAVINLGLGYSLGLAAGGSGVVIAWTLALAAGSLVIPAGFKRDWHIPLSAFIPEYGKYLIPSCGTAAAIALFFYYQFRPVLGLKLTAAIQVCGMLPVIAFVVASNPMLRKLWGNLNIHLSGKVR